MNIGYQTNRFDEYTFNKMIMDIIVQSRYT